MSQQARENVALYDTLVEMVKPIVANIEAQVGVTMGRYDQYMSALTRIAGIVDPRGEMDQRKLYLLLGRILLQAGANRRGVESALMVMGHR